MVVSSISTNNHSLFFVTIQFQCVLILDRCQIINSGLHFYVYKIWISKCYASPCGSLPRDLISLWETFSEHGWNRFVPRKFYQKNSSIKISVWRTFATSGTCLGQKKILSLVGSYVLQGKNSRRSKPYFVTIVLFGARWRHHSTS